MEDFNFILYTTISEYRSMVALIPLIQMKQERLQLVILRSVILLLAIYIQL